MPVYDSKDKEVQGILYTKDLIGEQDISQKTAGDLCSNTKLIIVEQSRKLDSLLNLLIHQKLHMALIVDAQGDFVGIATPGRYCRRDPETGTGGGEGGLKRKQKIFAWYSPKPYLCKT